jgi:hypothetical protein
MFQELRLRYREDKKEIWKETGLRLTAAACLFSIVLSISVIASALLQGVTNPVVIVLPVLSAGGAVLLRLLCELVLAHIHKEKDREAVSELTRVLIPALWLILMSFENRKAAGFLVTGGILILLAEKVLAQKAELLIRIKIILTEAFYAGSMILILTDVQKETASLSAAVLCALIGRNLLETASRSQNRVSTNPLAKGMYSGGNLLEAGILLIFGKGLLIGQKGLFGGDLRMVIIGIVICSCLHALSRCFSLGKEKAPVWTVLIPSVLVNLYVFKENLLTGLVFLFCLLILFFVLPFFASLIKKNQESGSGYEAAGHAVFQACMFFLCVFVMILYRNGQIGISSALLSLLAWWGLLPFLQERRSV